MDRETITENRPWTSTSLGVHPADIEKTRENIKKEGGRFEINNQGFVVAKSKTGHNDALKFFGRVNADGGYGDYTGS